MAPSGYLVYVPLVRSVSGERVLVNRGWISASDVQRLARDGGALCEDAGAEVEVRGVVSSGEAGNAFSPSHEAPEGAAAPRVRGTGFRQFFWQDLASIKEAAGMPEAAWAVVAVSNPVALGSGAGDGEALGAKLVTTPLSTYAEFWAMPETHVTYAATWFMLCAAGTVMTRRMFRSPVAAAARAAAQ